MVKKSTEKISEKSLQKIPNIYWYNTHYFLLSYTKLFYCKENLEENKCIDFN